MLLYIVLLLITLLLVILEHRICKLEKVNKICDDIIDEYNKLLEQKDNYEEIVEVISSLECDIDDNRNQ